MNHHCRRHSSRDKYCKNNPPRGNQEKESKIDLAKHDLEDRTYKKCSLTVSPLAQEEDLIVEQKRSLIMNDDNI
jgi:hypothetical protein